VGLGLALGARDDFSGSMANYARAIEIDPKHGDANNNFANGLARQQRWDEAIEHYRIAAEEIPDRAEVHLNLGNALLQSGKPTEALAAYRRAQAVSPALPTARYTEALALDSLGRRGAAAQIFADLLRQPSAPQWTFSPDVMSRLADYLATCQEPGLRNPEEALKLVETARRLDAPEFQTMVARAAALAAGGEFEDAVTVSDAALRLSEGAAVHPDRVALARERREAYQNGRAVYQECAP
jgi:tetratricopeptide (TPR) repeat protein